MVEPTLALHDASWDDKIRRLDLIAEPYRRILADDGRQDYFDYWYTKSRLRISAGISIRVILSEVLDNLSEFSKICLIN